MWSTSGQETCKQPRGQTIHDHQDPYSRQKVTREVDSPDALQHVTCVEARTVLALRQGTLTSPSKSDSAVMRAAREALRGNSIPKPASIRKQSLVLESLVLYATRLQRMGLAGSSVLENSRGGQIERIGLVGKHRIF